MKAVLTGGGLLVLSGTAPAREPPPIPSRALVDDVAAAAEDRDADRVARPPERRVPGPEALGQGRIVAASLRRYFAAYESIDLEVFDVQTEAGDGVTQIRTRVGFTGKAQKAFGLEGLLPPSAVYAFDFDARDEGGVWRVTRASWEVVTGRTPTPVP